MRSRIRLSLQIYKLELVVVAHHLADFYLLLVARPLLVSDVLLGFPSIYYILVEMELAFPDPDYEARALSDIAHRMDRPAMQLHDLLGERKAEARAFAPPC